MTAVSSDSDQNLFHFLCPCLLQKNNFRYLIFIRASCRGRLIMLFDESRQSGELSASFTPLYPTALLCGGLVAGNIFVTAECSAQQLGFRWGNVQKCISFHPAFAWLIFFSLPVCYFFYFKYNHVTCLQVCDEAGLTAQLVNCNAIESPWTVSSGILCFAVPVLVSYPEVQGSLLEKVPLPKGRGWYPAWIPRSLCLLNFCQVLVCFLLKRNRKIPPGNTKLKLVIRGTNVSFRF